MADNEFGDVLRAWFSRNEWPQMVAEQVARAKGSKIGPWASQMSNAMQGKLEPKPPFFVALGWFNQIVTERDFVGITDRRLVDRLLNGQPLTHDDGQPWTAVDFFALYIGDIPAPGEETEDPKADEPIAMTQESSDWYWSEMRLVYRELVVEMMIGPPAVWEEIKKILISKGISLDDIDWVREIMAGVRTPTLEESNRVRAKYPAMPLVTTFMELKTRSGGSDERLGKLLRWVEQTRGCITPRFGLPVGNPDPIEAPKKRSFGFEASACLKKIRLHVDAASAGVYSLRVKRPSNDPSTHPRLGEISMPR